MLKSFIASFYIGSQRIFRVLSGGSQALFEGFWMGLLPESVYDVISEKSYGDGRQYSNAQYLDQGFRCLQEDLAVRTYFPADGRVLVASAGGGRELIALARGGSQAFGFECSHAMVEAGQRALTERGIGAPLIWAPPSVAPLVDGGPFNDPAAGLEWCRHQHHIFRRLLPPAGIYEKPTSAATSWIACLGFDRDKARNGAAYAVDCAYR